MLFEVDLFARHNEEPIAVNDVASPSIVAAEAKAYGRWAEVLLGLAFIASAVLKAADINGFIVQIYRYGMMVMALQTGAALLVLLLETGLGMALVLGLMRRFTLMVSGLLLVGFTGLVLYGWLTLGMDDCGCMGIVKMHPAISILKNLVLLALAVVAWRGLVTPRPEKPTRTWRRRLWRLALFMLAFAAAATTTGYAGAHVDPVQPGIMGPRPFSVFVFEAQERTWDLGKGEYFVALLSTRCPHCKKAVVPLNELHKREGFPPVVGLCKGSGERYEKFLEATHPEFPTQTVGTQDFYRLIGLAIPRFVLVRDGNVVKVWDGKVPSAEAIEKARATAQPESNPS